MVQQNNKVPYIEFQIPQMLNQYLLLTYTLIHTVSGLFLWYHSIQKSYKNIEFGL